MTRRFRPPVHPAFSPADEPCVVCGGPGGRRWNGYRCVECRVVYPAVPYTGQQTEDD